jgi:hypothetical protein
MLITEEIVDFVETQLVKVGYSNQKPDTLTAWNVFKAFSKVPVQCNEEGLLFECGVYSFTGEELFSLGFVRQFEFLDEDCEYDHMEQFHFIVYYKPCEELKKLQMNKWSFDFSSYDAFFTYIESLDAFMIPIQKYSPTYSIVDCWTV